MIEITDHANGRTFRCKICQAKSGPPNKRAKSWVHQCAGQNRNVIDHPCKHLGVVTEETHQCQGCPGSPRVHAKFSCQVHGSCLPLATVTGIHCCTTCNEYEAENSPQETRTTSE